MVAVIVLKLFTIISSLGASHVRLGEKKFILYAACMISSSFKGNIPFEVRECKSYVS